MSFNFFTGKSDRAIHSPPSIESQPLMEGDIVEVPASVQLLMLEILLDETTHYDAQTLHTLMSIQETLKEALREAKDKPIRCSLQKGPRPCLITQSRLVDNKRSYKLCLLATFGSADEQDFCGKILTHFATPVYPYKKEHTKDHLHTFPEWEYLPQYIIAHPVELASCAARELDSMPRWKPRKAKEFDRFVVEESEMDCFRGVIKRKEREWRRLPVSKRRRAAENAKLFWMGSGDDGRSMKSKTYSTRNSDQVSVARSSRSIMGVLNRDLKNMVLKKTNEKIAEETKTASRAHKKQASMGRFGVLESLSATTAVH